MCIYGNSKSINMQSSQRQRNQTNNYFISWRKRRDRPQINIFIYRLWIEFDSSNCGKEKLQERRKKEPTIGATEHSSYSVKKHR